ncbi:unnamed protein product, partial [Polarella glacialis]
AERELRAAQAALDSSAQERRRGLPGSRSPGEVSSRLQADQERLNKVRASLAREAEVRRSGAQDLQDAQEELEALREELKTLTLETTHLRSGLQWTMEGLERIHCSASGGQVPFEAKPRAQAWSEAFPGIR